LSVTYRDIQKFKIGYETQAQITDTTDDKTKIGRFNDNLLRHLIIGGELLLMKNFNAALGYNFRRNKELAIKEKTSIVGLTFGFGITISGVKIRYAHQFYHLAGGTNHISLSTHLSNFGKKNKEKSLK
ncbi:MAG: hypothetical protein SNJ71_01330, partial [Bacteroidales bacterium]